MARRYPPLAMAAMDIQPVNQPVTKPIGDGADPQPQSPRPREVRR
jgi:hypothetical protein